eukprot:14777059-Ditylum_brightwellii.AAC.1
MKENRAFMKHLEVNKIFINVTTLTAVVQEIWVWCAISHPNQTCRDKAKAELNSWLSLDKDCKLNQHLIWAKKNNAKSNTTRALVMAGGAEVMEEGIEQLLAFNDLPQEEKDLYPHT